MPFFSRLIVWLSVFLACDALGEKLLRYVLHNGDHHLLLISKADPWILFLAAALLFLPLLMQFPAAFLNAILREFLQGAFETRISETLQLFAVCLVSSLLWTWIVPHPFRSLHQLGGWLFKPWRQIWRASLPKDLRQFEYEKRS